MALHTARAHLHQRDRSDDLLAAPAAKCLTRLHCRTASVAKHEVLPGTTSDKSRRSTDNTKKLCLSSQYLTLRRRTVRQDSRQKRISAQRKGHPATGWPLLQGRIVPTEH